MMSSNGGSSSSPSDLLLQKSSGSVVGAMLTDLDTASLLQTGGGGNRRGKVSFMMPRKWFQRITMSLIYCMESKYDQNILVKFMIKQLLHISLVLFLKEFINPGSFAFPCGVRLNAYKNQS